MGQMALYNDINIKRGIGTPVYLQLTNAIIKTIQQGSLRPGNKMLGIKVLADLLKVNKNTIERVYDELEVQQWVIRIPRKGTFVSEKLPKTKPREWNSETVIIKNTPETAVWNPAIYTDPSVENLIFDDGFPDPRVVDHLSIGRAHRSIFRSKRYHPLFSYTNPYGDITLRSELAKYLNDTRGIQCSEENILITRGSQMAIFLGMRTILQKGEFAVVGAPNYFGANNTLSYIGANILTVPVDEEGLVVDEIVKHCKKYKVRLMYTTPHHHHPTTVALSPARRMELLKLAEKYGIVILEDDYDYDFHYGNAPILPLSSVDSLKQTIYTGSFSKTIAPALRIGYLLASKEIIEKAVGIRRVIDHQGDPIMEHLMALLIQQGEIERMLRRSRKIYKQRREHFCQVLETHFADCVRFKVPEGGLAVWVRFNPTINVVEIAKKALIRKLNLATANHYGQSLNALRLGFASRNQEEIDKGLEILKSVIA